MVEVVDSAELVVVMVVVCVVVEALDEEDFGPPKTIPNPEYVDVVLVYVVLEEC